MKKEFNKKILWKDSLSFKLLIWFLFLSLVPLIIFAIQSYNHNANKIKETSTYDLLHSSTLQKNYIENWFNFRHSDILSWSQSFYSTGLLTRLNEVLDQNNNDIESFIRSYAYAKLIDRYQNSFITLKKNYDYIYDIFLIDKNGNILYNITKEKDLSTNLISGPYSSSRFSSSYQRTLKDKEVHFSDLEYYEASNNKISGFLTAPIIDDYGEFIGVLAVELKLDNVFSIFKPKTLHISYLVGEDGLLRTNISEDKENLDFKVDLEFLKTIEEKHVFNYKNSLNEEVFGIYDSINIFGVDWILVNEIEYKVIFESKKEFAILLLVFLLFIAIIIFIVARYVSLQITKPLNLLVKASRDFSKGDREEIASSGENDEVQQLTYAFNKMITSLAKKEYLLIKKSKELAFSKNELQNYTYELEDKISDEVSKNIMQQQALFNQTRLAQMGEMISMIAHQWRQPLSAISTTAIDLQIKIELQAFDLTKQDGRDKYEQYSLSTLGNINKYVQNLTTTIDDFRDFYKPNKKLVTLSSDEIILKALNIIKVSLLSDNIEIIEIYNSSQKIEVHENEMMQVVLNLLKNAQDNFKEKDVQNRYIKIITDEKRISICDNGGGIDENIIEKIFDPYFSTKDAKNGTGLGLYMSKIIVEDHHCGSLSVQNKGDGVCFIIDIGNCSNEIKTN